METKTNWLAIIACAIGGMLLGFLFYGMLFQSQWMDGNGITQDLTTMKMMKNGAEMSESPTPMIVNTIAMLVYALIINWLLNKTGSHTLASGAQVGASVGLISLIGIFVGHMFSQAPMNLSMIDGSYTFLLFTMMGAILGAWQKK